MAHQKSRVDEGALNPYLPTGKSVIDQERELTGAVKIHAVSGLALGGFFGGPIAMSYLIYRDLVTLGRMDLLRGAAAWFGPFILFWFYGLVSFPRDFISQFVPYLPQTILWWVVARHLLRDAHAGIPERGVLFVSRWRAVGFGLSTFVALKLLFLVAQIAF